MNFAHFEGLYRGDRYDPVFVCSIDPIVAQAIGATVMRVALSLDTVNKQKEHHPDLRLEDYKGLLPTLCYGEFRADGPTGAVVLYEGYRAHRGLFRAFVKSAKAGRELYVTSFNKLIPRQLDKARRKPQVIIRPHRR